MAVPLLPCPGIGHLSHLLRVLFYVTLEALNPRTKPGHENTTSADWLVPAVRPGLALGPAGAAAVATGLADQSPIPTRRNRLRRRVFPATSHHSAASPSTRRTPKNGRLVSTLKSNW